MDANTDILESLQHIITHMATKDDVRAIVREIIHDEVTPIVRDAIEDLVPGFVALEIKPLAHTLQEISRRLDTLEESFHNLRGVTKEIDELRTQIWAIETHLGIKRTIAA